MATRNFSFSLKKASASELVLFLVLSVVLAGCQSWQTRESIRNANQPAEGAHAQAANVPEALKPPENNAPPTPPSLPPSPAPGNPEAARENPRIGLILGPGAARAFAHVGVLQELTKAKLPITHIVGFEMGALVGAIYAQKAQTFDVEWQINKLKDIKSLASFLQNTFGGSRAEDLRLPFSCPAYNLAKSQYFMMNRGVVTQMLPYCLPVPPVMKAHNQNVAGITELRPAIDYLRSKGANFIVYVHVLPSKNGIITGSLDDENNFLWTLTSLSIAKQWQAVDYVVTVPVQDFDLMDWGHRREMIQKGIEAGQNAASQISKRLGL